MHFDPKGMLEVFPKARRGGGGGFAAPMFIIGFTLILKNYTSNK